MVLVLRSFLAASGAGKRESDEARLLFSLGTFEQERRTLGGSNIPHIPQLLMERGCSSFTSGKGRVGVRDQLWMWGIQVFAVRTWWMSAVSSRSAEKPSYVKTTTELNWVEGGTWTHSDSQSGTPVLLWLGFYSSIRVFLIKRRNRKWHLLENTSKFCFPKKKKTRNSMLKF